jgi:hypothetical protein
MTYTGLNTDKQEVTLNPGYYLPYVHYGVIDSDVEVKAGYIYRGISFDPENLAQVDFVLPADYFDADGNFVEKDKAAFIAKFRCAIDPNFEANDQYGVIAYKADGTTIDPEHDGVGTAGANGTSTTRDQKWIPYGNKFVITLDKVNVTWKSILGAYINATDTKGASYFKTNFSQFTSTYDLGKDESDDNAAFYKDELATKTPIEKEGFLYRNGQAKVDYVRVVGMAKPEVTKVVIYSAKKNASGKLNVLATLEGDVLKNKIGDYFAVSAAAETVAPFGLLFEPKVNSLNPTEVGKFEITVGVPNMKLVHQWAHTSNVTDGGKKITVYNPKSNPEIEAARQAR